jgi:hypothetical protein
MMTRKSFCKTNGDGVNVFETGDFLAGYLIQLPFISPSQFLKMESSMQ